MKLFMISLICIVFSAVAYGQNKQGGMVDELVVNQPKFVGVEQAVKLYNGFTENISEYVVENFNISDDVLWAEGTEIIRFIVTSTGELQDFEVINSVHPKVDSEIMRVLSSTSGMWIPGMSNGQPVSMEKEISICFSNCYTGDNLSEVECDFVESAVNAFNKGNEKFLVQGKERQALKSYDKGIKYLPNDEALLLMRGLCRYSIDDEEGAIDDWTRLTENGDYEVVIHLVEKYSYLDGVDEFIKLANR